MKAKNRIITAVLLSAGAAVGTALINKYIKMSAVSRNLLAQPEPRCYRWRLGNIYYTKTGTGKPLLLVHDLTHASSGCEWDSLIPLLKEHYTIYTIDLLGCGRSEKPNLTYTNFLYVQLLNDFVKSEIGRRTNIVATGASAPIATMACGYNPDLFEQMMFINPDSLLSCCHIPGKSAKCYKLILDLLIVGTLLYNFASARSIISKTFSENDFYNPYDVNPHNLDKYYESAHLGDSPKSVYASVQCNYTKCNITKTLEKIDNSIYILGGEAEPDIDLITKEYTKCNQAIESSTIANTKHIPQIEKPEEVSSIIQMFFN